MSARAGQSARQRRVAAELRRLRELALFTADEVAKRLGWSASKISRMENARIVLKPRDVEPLLVLYQVSEEGRRALLALLADQDRKNWWDAYADILHPDDLTLISFEAEASAVRNYEPMVVPGLLQTEAYARRIIYMWHFLSNTPPSAMERRLEVRLTRQRILTSPAPVELHVVIDEAVLRRQVDRPPVMREQLDHLVAISERPNIEIRILPLSGQHITSTGPHAVLRIAEFGDVAYLENFTHGHLYVDNAAVIYQHSLVFDSLSRAALSPDESRRLISQTSNTLWK